MTPRRLRRPHPELWQLAAEQHGVVTRAQLLGRGLSSEAVRHRVAAGRLHPKGRGIYAVGRPLLSRHGEWMAAILSCGPRAVLSHLSAALLWGILGWQGALLDVSVPFGAHRRRPGVSVHRRAIPQREVTEREGIPVTTPALSLLDLATRLGRGRLEAAINEADKLDLIDPEALRDAVSRFARRPGAPALRKTLDRRTFTLTDSELERRFLPLASRAGLGPPQTGRRVSGYKVDFYWHELGLVVETDGLRYHRTPAQQSRDRLRDQAHTAAGLTPLRFTHAQVVFDSGEVVATLRAVGERLGRSRHDD